MSHTLTATHSNINRGELYHANLDPIIGSEQGGLRPVMIVQSDMGNRHSPTTIVAPITSRPKRKLPTHLLLPKQQGLKEGSMVLFEQLRTLDKSRLGKYIGRVNAQTLKQIDGCLSVSLGLDAIREEPLLMSLCKSCADSYRDSGDYKVHRIDYYQQIKEPCTLCSRLGFDYEVIRKCDI